VERVVLKQEHAPDLAGWVADRKGSCGTIVLLHGRGSNKAAMVPRAKLLFERGYSVMLFDLSGHGESDGDVRGFGYAERRDASRILAFARQRFAGHKIAAVGSSLGAAAFVFAAQQERADAYVLEQLYATLRETTALRAPLPMLRDVQAAILLAQMPLRLGFDVDDVRPVDRISAIDRPILLLDGSSDPFVDRGQTLALKDAAGADAELIWFDGARHVDLYRYNEQLYRDTVVPFLKKNLCLTEAK
jgi:alpha-beta hydrolase superfamily lysophospholipase